MRDRDAKGVFLPDSTLQPGVVFTKWILIRRDPTDSSKWLCECSCGRKRSVVTNTLTGGTSTGCGVCERVKSRRFLQGEAGFRNLWSHYQSPNYSTGVRTFLLTESEFRTLVTGNCFYCGVEPFASRATGWSRFVYNGIDRVDNNKGYEPGNVVSCCKTCNQAKCKMSQIDFYAWVRRVHSRLLASQPN